MSLVWLPQPQLSCAAHEAAFGAPILHPRRRRRSKTGSSSSRLEPLSRGRRCLASRHRIQQPGAGWRCTASRPKAERRRDVGRRPVENTRPAAAGTRQLTSLSPLWRSRKGTTSRYYCFHVLMCSGVRCARHGFILTHIKWYIFFFCTLNTREERRTEENASR